MENAMKMEDLDGFRGKKKHILGNSPYEASIFWMMPFTGLFWEDICLILVRPPDFKQPKLGDFTRCFYLS